MDSLHTFHVWQNGQSQGPFTVRVMQDMIKQGTLSRQALVAYRDSEDWVPLSTYADLIDPAKVEVPDPVSVPEAHTPAATGNLDSWTEIFSAAGGLFVVLGLGLMFYFSVCYEIAVGRDEVGSYYKSTTSKVNNLGLISDREAGVLFGGFLFVGGCVICSRPRPTS
jgi:hypothetical protein